MIDNAVLFRYHANMSSYAESGEPGLEGLSGEGLLDLAERALAAVIAQPLEEELGDARLAESVQRLYRLETMAAAEKLRRIAEVDARQAWREEGVRSTAGMLMQRLRLTRGEARGQTETAVALASLLETAAALRAGAVGLGQVKVATRMAKDLRSDVREELDQLVAGEGRGLDRRQLRVRVEEWVHTVDPEALAGRERRAWANRRLWVNAEGADGAVRGGFELDPVGGATLIAALDALSKRRMWRTSAHSRSDRPTPWSSSRGGRWTAATFHWWPCSAPT